MEFGFEPKLFQETEYYCQYIFEFENGYGACLNKNSANYIYDKELYEIYVMENNVVDTSDKYQEFRGYKTKEEIIEILKKINFFKKAK